MLQLKDTVNGLLALPSSNVWNIHGGLERLVRCVRHILKHKIKASSVCSLHCVTYLSVIVILVKQIIKAAMAVNAKRKH